jgi:hypothetical protein
VMSTTNLQARHFVRVSDGQDVLDL